MQQKGGGETASSSGTQGLRPWDGKVHAISPDEQWVAVAGSEHTVDVWQMDQGRHWSTYYGHRDGMYNRRGPAIEEIAWVDNEQVVSGSQDGAIHLWNARTGIHVRTLVNVGDRQGRARVQDFVQSRASSVGSER